MKLNKMVFPSPLPLDDAPDSCVESGLLDVTEKIDGIPCRIVIDNPDGEYRLGDDNQIFPSPEVAPDVFEPLYDYLDTHLDVQQATEHYVDHGAYSILGVATYHNGIDYDWSTTPLFLGFALHHHDQDTLQRPQYSRIAITTFDLDCVPPIRRIPAEWDFGPDALEIPDSQYRDGAAAGIVIWNTDTDDIVQYTNPDCPTEKPDPLSEGATATDAADRLATRERIQTYIEGGETAASEGPDIADEVYYDILREEYATLVQADTTFSLDEFRDAVTENVQTVLRDYRRENDAL